MANEIQPTMETVEGRCILLVDGKLMYLCPSCQSDQFRLPQNEGYLPLGTMRLEARQAELAQYESPDERLAHAILDPFEWSPNISVEIDGIADINLTEVDEIQAGDDGWIISYGRDDSYGRCRHCGEWLLAIRFGAVCVTWLRQVGEAVPDGK